ncbi:MAG: cytochrome P450 [Proteobacteria bacterium]|nr:cytochrome P450 [Pseudomonadota bacterium]
MQVAKCPKSEIDLYADESLLDPYPLYKQLRDLGAVVWLPQYQMYVLSRFKEVKEALRNSETFSSAQGVMMNERMNQQLRGIVLCSDGAEHMALRRVIAKPLTQQAIAEHAQLIANEAEALIERLVAKKHFDAATELAQYLPVTVVSNLVGLPEEGRERMLDWAAANFQCFGPMNARTSEAFVTVKEMIDYAFTECTREKLKPDGWAKMIWDAADRGEISMDKPPLMMNDYMGPSLDTTIFTTSSMIWLFATHPEQWDILRADPSLIPGAINEAIRVESPIQGFSRVATQDVEVDGVTLPKDARAIVLYGSANRDERKWGNADDFDIRRRNAEQVGFGHGSHACVGMHLARMEMTALLKALLPRVKRFELGATERVINNVLHGFAKVEITVH